ncbi:MAG: hypothetical protein R6U51_02780 [Anaerolineales bacterium]
MKTPAGQECRYFYGDYHRGRNHEECRLLKSANPPQEWNPQLCFTCPVPGILQANACEHMKLKPTVHRPLFILKPRVKIEAYCKKTNRIIEEPHVGCGECHDLPDVFLGQDER